MAYNVFISYSSKNMNIDDWARATLAQPGHVEVFAAEYSVLPSQVLNDEIEKLFEHAISSFSFGAMTLALQITCRMKLESLKVVIKQSFQS